MSKPDGGNAFPSQKVVGDGGDETPFMYEITSGLTVRDYFAASALTGLVMRLSDESLREQAAKTAYALADDMLKERDK